MGVIGAICSILGLLGWLLWPKDDGTSVKIDAGQNGVVQAPVNSPNAVIQNMSSSPGSTQIAVTGDLNVNTDRHIRGILAETLQQRLKASPCSITVGVLGMGGEPDALANEFLRIAKSAGCPVKGVYHSVSSTSFDGIQIRYSPINTPTKAIQSLIEVLREADFAFVSGQDPTQKDGSIYIYVGNKP